MRQGPGGKWSEGGSKRPSLENALRSKPLNLRNCTGRKERRGERLSMRDNNRGREKKGTGRSKRSEGCVRNHGGHIEGRENKKTKKGDRSKQRQNTGKNAAERRRRKRQQTQEASGQRNRQQRSPSSLPSSRKRNRIRGTLTKVAWQGLKKIKGGERYKNEV